MNVQRLLLFPSFWFWWDKNRLSSTKMNCKGDFMQLSWASPNDSKLDTNFS